MRALAFALAVAAAPAAASDLSSAITDQLILPAFQTLAEEAQALAETAKADCNPQSGSLRAAYGAAFDAWIAASPYRFGPTETDSRAFALAFWPDSRSKTPKALASLIRSEDPGISDPAQFASHSIAARGFYALEYLLYDPQLSSTGSAGYRCALTRAISADIAATSAAISRDWTENYAAEMRRPAGRYQSENEITQQLLKVLSTGLQVLDDMRLGRPLGTYDRPRPARAEARRSGRSLRHVLLSLNALEPLALALAGPHADLQTKITAGFSKARKTAETLDDPVFAGAADPAGRFRIESLQQEIKDLRALVAGELGPALGVEAGFNSLDGD
ncbi:imelysin family protein [Leisingera methylohalidivorans]|uniref:Peptidase M75 n=1 Tax=Leisingera methylohalidivorans DSM 14336 TaxID=999552 RepID=V9VRS9_9RHOB|nr:imelysin family protein [Leisingera methylohalidivorans]AHD00035.1 peptidase M75 [Leisingera methylohalidivorans DSM 14336]